MANRKCGRAGCWFALAFSLFAVGCQSEYGGQLLPSAHWQSDDVQYFPPGPEFKLSREAAALAAVRRQDGSRRPGSINPLPAPAPAPAGAAPIPAEAIPADPAAAPADPAAAAPGT